MHARAPVHTHADPDLPSRVRLDGVVTVVDAKHVLQHLDDKKPEGVVNEAVEQVRPPDHSTAQHSASTMPAPGRA